MKEYLLLVAGFTWLIAGLILLSRGISFIIFHGHHRVMEMIIASLIGILFYLLLFVNISLRHIKRIRSKTDERHSIFSFMDSRGYILMTVMISAGIVLRHMRIINPEYLYTFYIGMGIPLLVSSLTFFSTWRRGY